MKKRIPTNLITGFLGTGKTTAVLHLLKKKPANEKWSVLVNEFGEVGIDGAILRGHGAEIREVAGGCMCCVADLPMKVALNMLIARTKPDRLLIETTGLGHPQALIDTLSDEYYGDILDLRAVLCLVDPRKLRDSRYLEHKIFRDQLAIADTIVANKIDLCAEEDHLAFKQITGKLSSPKLTLGWVSHGQLPLDWLNPAHGGQRIAPRATPQKQSFLRTPPTLPEPISLRPGENFARRENRGDGYFSCGWLFAEHTQFDFQVLVKLLAGLNVARVKGLMKTNQGNYIFNDEDGTLNVSAVEGNIDSIIEMIHDAEVDWQSVENAFLQCSG